jgi:hypothetical protein
MQINSNKYCNIKLIFCEVLVVLLSMYLKGRIQDGINEANWPKIVSDILKLRYFVINLYFLSVNVFLTNLHMRTIPIADEIANKFCIFPFKKSREIP